MEVAKYRAYKSSVTCVQEHKSLGAASVRARRRTHCLMANTLTCILTHETCSAARALIAPLLISLRRLTDFFAQSSIIEKGRRLVSNESAASSFGPLVW